jgi:DNA-binding response OmpR family regulator
MPDHQPIVLVVEDDSAIAESLREALEMDGYEPWLASTADAALERLELEMRPPEVVMLDLVLPGMPVRQFISRLKDRSAWARAPIILTTAASERMIPKDLQVDALLPKPFRLEELLDLVRTCARRGELPTPSPGQGA